MADRESDRARLSRAGRADLAGRLIARRPNPPGREDPLDRVDWPRDPGRRSRPRLTSGPGSPAGVSDFYFPPVRRT
jgi:hypothetical protein